MLESQRGKVTRRHLERHAVVYIRQSTLRQVQHNTESTQRQYALREQAAALGWHADQIRVLDEDLGKSGASAENREGFRQLVASVAVGEVGMVLGLEVSRLARNNADWHRLLELASHSRTLILDETGIYDPHELNDRILLGIKGQFSEIELFSLVARLHGGIRNKAQRGELKLRLPMGLVYRQDGSVALDPDNAVEQAVRCVFDTFQELESATATWRWLAAEGVRLPGQVRHGPHKGQRLWLAPSLSRVLSYLNNPRYAGAFAWGRRDRASAGSPATPSLADRWQVLLPSSHPGYIDWERFVANQAILDRNRGHFQDRLPVPRQGCALLQSRVLCGRCGGRMVVHYVRYAPKDGSEPATHAYYICRDKRLPTTGRACQSVSAKAIDAAVERQIIAAVRAEHVTVALAVQQEVQGHAAQAAAARQERLRQLEYQAELAAQRYYAVDPRNRTVAAQLESDWDACLRSAEQARSEHQRLTEADQAMLTAEARQRIEGLVRNFSRLWHDPQTQPADRKRMLATIVEDATLLRSPDHCRVQLRFHGGALREVEVPLPCGAAKLQQVHPELVELVARLSADRNCEEIAAELNRQGYTAYQGRPYSAAGVRRILHANGVPSRTEQMRARGLRTAGEIAATLGVSHGTVRHWGTLGLLPREFVAKGPQRTHALYALPNADTVAEILRHKGKWSVRHPLIARNEEVCHTA